MKREIEMVHNTLISAKTVLELINKTKTLEISWIRLDELKDYLERESVQISQVSCLNKFFISLRSRREIPSFSNTYFVSLEGFVYAISKSQYSSLYRLYRYSIERAQWAVMHEELSTIVRLYNIIRLVDTQESDDEIVDFLYSMDQVHA